MPALAPIPPEQLKRLLETLGWSAIGEDQYNWLLDREGNTGPPITIPKIGPLVAIEAMMAALHQAQVNDGQYFEALKAVTN
jgi:hypothetical protein